ncbi:MAG: hypothetical protein QG553_272 [Patescibacteria group bacterium]|nr:hypothetical protein [Patescibacteria group bacterium]
MSSENPMDHLHIEVPSEWAGEVLGGVTHLLMTMQVPGFSLGRDPQPQLETQTTEQSAPKRTLNPDFFAWVPDETGELKAVVTLGHIQKFEDDDPETRRGMTRHLKDILDIHQEMTALDGYVVRGQDEKIIGLQPGLVELLALNLQADRPWVAKAKGKKVGPSLEAFAKALHIDS